MWSISNNSFSFSKSERPREEEMWSISNNFFPFSTTRTAPSTKNQRISRCSDSSNFMVSNSTSYHNSIGRRRCQVSESGTEENRSSKTTGLRSNKGKMEEYNTAMKRMMRNPYEYHHDLGMNYTLIFDNLIVGSQPQKPDDIYHLRHEENVKYILNLQQDKDIEYWGIDFDSILRQCKELGVHHMRRPARDFDPDSLRSQLPVAVSTLEWAISEGNGNVYVHCTAGLGRAPAVAVAYMFWFCGMNLNEAYDELTSKRPCGPNKTAIRGATYDLAKYDPWKESFDNLPEFAFEDVSDWERKLIQERVRALRGT